MVKIFKEGKENILRIYLIDVSYYRGRRQRP